VTVREACALEFPKLPSLHGYTKATRGDVLADCFRKEDAQKHEVGIIPLDAWRNVVVYGASTAQDDDAYRRKFELDFHSAYVEAHKRREAAAVDALGDVLLKAEERIMPTITPTRVLQTASDLRKALEGNVDYFWSSTGGLLSMRRPSNLHVKQDSE